MTMLNPPHPGESIRHDCLEPLRLSVTDGAALLKVSRQALSNLVNGDADISPDMAVRLEKAGWGTAESWLRLQSAYDLTNARKKLASVKIQRYAHA